jgi:hypothetical protein
MDEKTEELRDIFMDVAEEQTVTESQTEQRGSLLRQESVDDRLQEVVERMREQFAFTTALDTKALCTIIKEFYDGESDEEIATVLRVPPEMVVDARMDLHLVRDSDTADVDVSRLRERLDVGDAVENVAAEMDADPVVIQRAARALDAEERARRVSQRFRTQYEEILTDADIAVRLTADVQDDGLDDATDGVEVDVEF